MTLTIATEPAPIRIDERGVARVGDTHLTLDVFVQGYDNGETPEEIVAAFPFLDLADVHAVISYVLRHRAEADAYLREGEEIAARARARIEARQGPQIGLRERLLARRKQQPDGT